MSQTQLAVTDSTRWERRHPQDFLRSVKGGLENYTACYGQEKKLWVSIAVCLCLPPSVNLSHATEALTLRRIKRDMFFYKEVLSFFLHHSMQHFYIFGAKGLFIPTWHDFEPGVKPTRSRERSMKRLTNKEKTGNKMKMKKKKKSEIQHT